MASTLFQMRIDEDIKKKACKVYDNLGIDMPTAVRIFFKRSISENGIPFTMSLNDKTSNKGIELLDKINYQSEKTGLSKMSLDEINAIISEARKLRRRNKRR